MGYKPYCLVSGALFALVALGHLVRIIDGLPVQVGEIDIPMFASWVGLILPGALAAWAFRLSRSVET